MVFPKNSMLAQIQKKYYEQFQLLPCNVYEKEICSVNSKLYHCVCNFFHYNLELTKIQIFKGGSGLIYSFNILHTQGVKNVKSASRPNRLTKNHK
jgi:hypothetical protein